jgi:hypothetical protein
MILLYFTYSYIWFPHCICGLHFWFNSTTPFSVWFCFLYCFSFSYLPITFLSFYSFSLILFFLFPAFLFLFVFVFFLYFIFFLFPFFLTLYLKFIYSGLYLKTWPTREQGINSTLHVGQNKHCLHLYNKKNNNISGNEKYINSILLWL